MEVGFRRPRHKKRRRHDIQTDKLKIYTELKEIGLRGLLIDSAVWVSTSSCVVKKLDHACLGNLDGGHGMTAYINAKLKNLDDFQGEKTVRLSLDEAFFIHYALGALDIYVLDKEQGVLGLDTKSAWKHMAMSRPDFPLLYLCYHHFRSKGWIPRTGLQYGVDFVLYQKHPALAHSDYSITIQTPGMTSGTIARPPLSWHDLQVTNRLTGQVGKRLILANIHDPAPHAGYNDHRCIDRVVISEYLVRRWVPERG